MKIFNAVKKYIPLIMLFTCSITMFPFFYTFTADWNEKKYGIILGALGLQLFISVFFTVFTKKHIVKRIIISLFFTALILGVILFIPIYVMNNIFYFGEVYASTLAIAPVVLIFAINAAVRLLRKGETKKYPVLRVAGLIICVAFSVIPFLNCLESQKNANAVGVYCHNANGVICVQNLFINCGEQAVQLNDLENSVYQGNNRVYGNLIVGNMGISVGDNSSISNYNIFASKLSQNAMKLNVEKKSYSLEKWQSMGFDTNSVCVPVLVSLNPQTLILTVNSSGKKIPDMPVVDSFSSGLIGSNELDYDLFSTERKDGAFGVGAFNSLPADETEICIDPRCAE